MAISYPLTLPTHTGIRSVEMRSTNVVAYARSPFTFAGQAYVYPGQMWQADLVLPAMKKENAERWIAWLVSLRGQYGTFLLGDPANQSIRGTATTVTVTGASGSGSVTVASDGTLLAGDMIQIGAGSDATLHKVLSDLSGNGTLEIWPALRKDRTAAAVTLYGAKGLFRLAGNEAAWSVNEASVYGISFSAMEAIS